MSLLEGKKGLVLGVANERSIAWGIAQAAAKNGARLGFNFLGDAQQKRVRPLADSLGAEIVEPLDATSDTEIDSFFNKVEKKWGQIDFLVHSIAFANKTSLRGRFVDTTRGDFHLAMDVSCYTLLSLSRRAARLMPPGSSILTLSYIGAVRAMPNYNVMGVAKAALEASVRYLAADLGAEGIRVNAISAGPIRTLAASAVSGFRELLDKYAQVAPLKRNVDTNDVGNSAVFILSELSSGVTGEILYVDAGFNIGPGMLV